MRQNIPTQINEDLNLIRMRILTSNRFRKWTNHIRKELKTIQLPNEKSH
jgi:hypothetical protein